MKLWILLESNSNKSVRYFFPLNWNVRICRSIFSIFTTFRWNICLFNTRAFVSSRYEATSADVSRIRIGNHIRATFTSTFNQVAFAFIPNMQRMTPHKRSRYLDLDTGEPYTNTQTDIAITAMNEICYCRPIIRFPVFIEHSDIYSCWKFKWLIRLKLKKKNNINKAIIIKCNYHKVQLL